MLQCYRQLRGLEQRLRIAPFVTSLLAAAIGALLVVDLFAYRLVPATRSLALGSISLDWLGAFGATGVWRPIALATSYLLTVWHATLVGILISGLALTALPASWALFRRRGLAGSLGGALFALPQPFCSCCSSMIAPSLVRGGASTQFVLAFVVGSPMLNVTTVALAVAMLPAGFAVTRIVAGIIITLIVTYGVARMAAGPEPGTDPSPSEAPGWLHRAGNVYLGSFGVDRIAGGQTAGTPSELFASWLTRSCRLALVLIPTIWLWSVLASVAFDILPLPLDNTPRSVVLAVVGGTFFMVSTWAEIPIALQLIQSGLPGPAAALLVVLPAVSLPCMMILGGALRRLRVIALLTAAVMLVGVTAGLLLS